MRPALQCCVWSVCQCCNHTQTPAHRWGSRQLLWKSVTSRAVSQPFLPMSLRRPPLSHHPSILPLLHSACPRLPLWLLHTHTCSHIIISLWLFVTLHPLSVLPFHSDPHPSHTNREFYFLFCIFCPLSVFLFLRLFCSPSLWLTLVFSTTVAHLTFPLSLY